MITVENFVPVMSQDEPMSIERLPLTSNDKENFVDTVRHFVKVCMGKCDNLILVHLYIITIFVVEN